MSGRRETLAAALFERLSAAYPFAFATRRPAAPEVLASPGKPAFALLSNHDKSAAATAAPRKLAMHFWAIVYVDVSDDDNAVADILINDILDAFDAALAPDNSVTGRCTLGGVAERVSINGEIVRAPGDKTGKGIALAPVEAILP